MDEPTYMTLPEVAELLRTPAQTLYRWRNRGEGPPCVKIGKRLLYRRAEVHAWVDAQALAEAS
jgi:excisionase family DNA binding protein